MWCMAIGRDLQPKELAVLFGHKDTPFGGHTPACITKMLGNSMHVAEAGHFMNAALKFKSWLHLVSTGRLNGSGWIFVGNGHLHSHGLADLR